MLTLEDNSIQKLLYDMKKLFGGNSALFIYYIFLKKLQSHDYAIHLSRTCIPCSNIWLQAV